MRLFLADNARFVKNNIRWIGGCFLLTMYSSFGQTFFVGLSGNDLRARFDLSGGEFGGLYMAATLMSAITLPWLGRTLDLMPGWKVARFTIPSLAVACVLVALAPYLAVLLLALYLLRLFGQGMMTEIAYTETGRWFVANRGRAMALVVLGIPAGTALFPVAAVLLTQVGGWQLPWIASALVLMLIGYPAILKLLSTERIPHSTEHHSDNARTARDWKRGEVIRDPVFYLLLAGTLAPPFIGTTIFFQQGYLITLRGYDPLVFAAAFPVGLITPIWGIYLFMFLLGISNGFTQTLLGALWPEVYGVANLGGIRAIIVSSMVLSTALGPGISGALIDMGVGLPTQMLWMAGWCVAASFGLAVGARIVASREAEGSRSGGS
jgi:hypothetical protein